MQEQRRGGPMSTEQLETLILTGEIDTLVIAIIDMQGRLMGKRITGEYCLKNGLIHGTHFCVYLLGTDMEMNTPGGYQMMNWQTGYGDWLAKPDWSTLRAIPWLEKTAWVLADAIDEQTGKPIAIAPRTILQEQLERARKHGLTFNMVSELEFYLFKESFEEIHARGYRDMKASGHYNEDYNLLQGTRNEHIYRRLRNEMVQAGIPIESSKGEAYTGQHEVNMVYTDALTAADRHVLFKHGAKEICMQEGYAITFMAKPHHRWTGSSGHLHLSLWDAAESRNLFYDAEQPYGMSRVMQHFLAGLLQYTREFSLFLANNVNSYKRYAHESWAPVHIVWSRDNRTAGFRVVGHGPSLRIECRIPGADINPYLAYSAMIAAGMAGIEQQIPLEAEFQGNAYAAHGVPRVPQSLHEATALWQASETVAAAFGHVVRDHYANASRVEQQAFESVVTDWERARYFEQG